ncbi:hypothetical protein DYB28_010872, partial [Aphanomyces astaci]
MEAPQRRHDTKPTRARHRNEYQRHAQKRYRKVRSGERQQLRQLVVELEAAKATAVAAASGRKNRPPWSTGMLSWADIALALQDAAQVSRSDAWELQVQVVNQARLGRAMWTYATNLLAARHVSLPRSAPARREGLDWITTQLYHNADAVVAGLGFPATGELFFDIQVAEERDGGHTVTIRHQREVDESWGSVTARIVATRLSPEKTLVTECWTVYALRRGDSNATWADEASFYKVNLAGNMDSSINDDDSPTEAQR